MTEIRVQPTAVSGLADAVDVAATSLLSALDTAVTAAATMLPADPHQDRIGTKRSLAPTAVRAQLGADLGELGDLARVLGSMAAALRASAVAYRASDDRATARFRTGAVPSTRAPDRGLGASPFRPPAPSPGPTTPTGGVSPTAAGPSIPGTLPW